MSGLLYRPDIDEVRKRLTVWWNGGDIGRPVLLITAPRPQALENIEPVSKPAGWSANDSARNFDYRVYLSACACVKTYYMGEAVPCVSPDLGPHGLALFLGCHAVDGLDTVWVEPCIERPEEAKFVHDQENFYWKFTLKLIKEQLRLGKGKFQVEFPDLIEGLDTLAAMRGTEKLLMDLFDRPAWVYNCLKQITNLYFRYYDILYEMIRDETGGSHFWAWAPGRMAKFQCDFSAMISPGMFKEFMVPVLTEMCERVSYSMYHWDGPGALAHCGHLLSISKLTMLQWTPGAGNEPVYHKRWWPLYHKIIDAGKKVFISCDTIEDLVILKKEFGKKIKEFMITMCIEAPAKMEKFLVEFP